MQWQILICAHKMHYHARPPNKRVTVCVCVCVSTCACVYEPSKANTWFEF